MKMTCATLKKVTLSISSASILMVCSIPVLMASSIPEMNDDAFSSYVDHKGDGKFSPYVDRKGNISLPKNFRVNMVHLGSWFVPDGGASGFHDVYTDKKSAKVFRKSGKFPDGATIVKELRPSQMGDYTTGSGISHATSDIKQWFVMIKDKEGRFADNPLWGDGWGWALYKSDDKNNNVATDYKTDCLGCHEPAKDKDYIYTEGYPTLNAEWSSSTYE